MTKFIKNQCDKKIFCQVKLSVKSVKMDYLQYNNDVNFQGNFAI